MKKAEIKKMVEDFQKAERDIQYWRNLHIEDKVRLEAIERKDGEHRGLLERDYHDEKTHNNQLLEIIRWQINAETAKYPFAKEKSQRTKREEDYMG